MTVKPPKHFGIVSWKLATVAEREICLLGPIIGKKKKSTQKNMSYIIYFQAEPKRTVNRKKEGSYKETLIPVYSLVVSYNT